ncbi:excinuclease ABC subunit UvrB [Candidatus Uhrbacteria bacterium]|nr:excinuclease ABC subunit UvrB [Candidatus Uhrbacteria bacterium]
MKQFQLKQPYPPAGDQPEAINKLTTRLKKGSRMLTLLGATGTGKTYTLANVINNIQKPTLVIAHNKTLAAQLCNEFREFFPDNAVEYFVSYYDYYQPEAYLPKSDTYIEKEAQINEEIDRLRHNATQSLLTRNDVIVCASVSCIYGLGAPTAYADIIFHLVTGEALSRQDTISRLINMQFTRTNADLTRGSFRLTGTTLEIMPVHQETVYRVEVLGNHIDRITQIHPVTRKTIAQHDDIWIFPAKHFITAGPEKERALNTIRKELSERVKYFESRGMPLEAERIERRTKYDLEMMENLGYCSGIENYSRPLSGRKAGDPPDTLISYFPNDFLLIMDESHVSIPQVGGMYAGDKSRKDTLIDHGFRLPSARDNRPLKFDEFERKIKQVVFMSATPGPYEYKNSDTVVEQLIRPTGLVDPEVIIQRITPKKKGDLNQIEDAIERIAKVTADKERVLVTTLTKKMAEDLTDFLKDKKIKAVYMHSDVKTADRLEILSEFRKGTHDVLVGVNLLREGLDLPEASLVCILDADKEGFLRSETSLIQTIGRAARNVRGKVVLYADNITGSMKRAIAETERRRTKQLEYNKKHGITPQTIKKAIKDLRGQLGFETEPKDVKKILALELAAEDKKLNEVIKEKETEMKDASLRLDFELAAILRDEIIVIRKELEKRKKKAPLPDKEAKPKIKKQLRHGRTK